MKKLIFYISIALTMAVSCKQTEGLLYNDIYRVQLPDTTALGFTFVYANANIVRDTVKIAVNTIGGITNYDRPVKLEQVQEYDYTVVRDPVTNAIKDTVYTAKPFTAKPGVHYVAFDDPAMAAVMVIHANKATDSIPVVLLRDASLADNSYRLRVQLVANEQFGLGESKGRARTIQFSDRLERFAAWAVDNTTAPAFITFGKYSVGKHQFMIDVLKTNIDQAWWYKRPGRPVRSRITATI
ncbi:DUF4843 domain-containing protein [Chitinophaga sedimenti]|uniref:DUF4843 domain-containing protein n=1 Tax=Chitinophaga sedimenti TaxID=2033606 RepID=UPI0020065823|nr:DUF4843 domain-containing protein [Chitinophaga sedimenti]MCK7556325.1 DUF4843 domain-containing protein [Chitinophaga sedimenti]